MGQLPSPPLIGSGILFPAMKHKFCVTFNKDVDTKLEQLSAQVIQVSPVSFWGNRKVSIMFEDDVTCKVATALWDIWSRSNTLRSIEIDYLDGAGTAVRTHQLSSCQLVDVEFSDLDYAGGSPEKTFTFIVPESETPLEIINALAGSQVTYVGERSTSACRIHATFQFDKFIMKPYIKS